MSSLAIAVSGLLTVLVVPLCVRAYLEKGIPG